MRSGSAGAMNADAVDALRVLGREQSARARRATSADDDRALGRGRVHHRERVGGELAARVRLRAHGPVRPPFPRPSNATTRQ